MDDVYGMGKIPCDLTKPRIALCKNTWKLLRNTVFWCNLKLAQEKGLQFYQTRSHAVVLYNTLLVACIEKAVCMKTQDELCQKVRLSPRVPRVVLKSNSQCGLQDPQNQDARASWEPSSDSKSYGETCNNTVDHRILGVLSADEQQNTTRENKAKRLIEKFENHKHRDSFIQDLKRTEKINKFSKESQDLIADRDNIVIFEFCENSSKQQCPDCNAHWEMGIIHCSCGRNMKSTRSPTEFDQNNRDVTSILGYVIKKNSSRGAKHGPSQRQKMYYQAKQMLKTARQGKHGGHPKIFSRWHGDEDYRKSLSTTGWEEHHIILYDRIFSIATRAERIQNSKPVNAEGGTQQPLNQRPDFAQGHLRQDCVPTAWSSSSTWDQTQWKRSNWSFTA